MVATAILLLDCQNEFVKSGGKLHDGVKEVLTQTGFMKNVPSFVELARQRGALIIHSPVLLPKVDAGEESSFDGVTFSTLKGLFQQGSWNSEIVDELKPENNDIVLSGRNDFSGFAGTELEEILHTRRIERLFVAGFMTDLCVLKTVVEAKKDLKLDIDVVVLMDGCVTLSAKDQFDTINNLLPDHCLTVTCTDGVEMLASNTRVSDALVTEPKKRTRKRFSMFDPVKKLRLAMLDKWIVGERFVRFLDRDADGKVSFEEFNDFLHQFGIAQELASYQVSVRAAWDILDIYNEGEVATDTLLEALRFGDGDLYQDLQEGHIAEEDKLEPFPSPYLVGLVAHNNMKPSMMMFVKKHVSFFSRVKLVTTGSTGRSLKGLNLEVAHLVASGPLGGDQQIGGLITQGKVAAIFFFTDPLSAHPHASDIEALNRLCCVHDTMFANNPSTANALVFALENSPFGYSRLTGLNPNIGTETAVVSKYKEGQSKVIQAVQETASPEPSQTSKTSILSSDNAEEETKKHNQRAVRSKSILRAPKTVRPNRNMSVNTFLRSVKSDAARIKEKTKHLQSSPVSVQDPVKREKPQAIPSPPVAIAATGVGLNGVSNNVEDLLVNIRDCESSADAKRDVEELLRLQSSQGTVVSEHIYKAGGMPILIVALATWHWASPDLCKSALSLIVSAACSVDACRRQLINIGGVNAVLMAAKKCPHEKGSPNTVQLLESLSIDDDTRTNVATISCVDFTMATMRAHPNDDFIIKSGCEYFDQLSKVSGKREALLAKRIASLLATCLDDFRGKDDGVYQSANKALKKFLD